MKKFLYSLLLLAIPRTVSAASVSLPINPGTAFTFKIFFILFCAVILGLIVLSVRSKQSSKKKILILGAKGMLGSALMKRLAETHEVIPLDRPELDITNEHAVKEKITAVKPDYIINAAAINAVDDIETKQEVFELAWKVNAQALETLGKISREMNIPVVHFSSDYVFDGHKKEGYTEDSEPKPESRYAETKFEGEHILKNIAEKYYIIRISRLFGQTGTGEGVKKSFVDKMLEEAASGKEVKVLDSEWSAPTYSKDVALFVADLIEKELPYGTYHAANKGACTWYEWAKEIFRLKNMNVEVQKLSESDLPRPAKRPMYSELLSTKAPAIRSWQEALKEYLETR